MPVNIAQNEKYVNNKKNPEDADNNLSLLFLE